jgi:DNA-binding transcriptional MerR regulator
MASAPELLLLGEVCRRLRLSEQGVRRLADSGVLPFQRTANGYRVFLRGDVERVRLERQRMHKEEVMNPGEW